MMHSHSRRCPKPPMPQPAGFTVFEMVLAVTLLAVVFGVLSPLVIRMGQQRQTLVDDQWALTHAGNLLDELTTTAPAHLTDRAAELAAEHTTILQQRLPQARLQIDVQPTDVPAPGFVITCQMEWTLRNGAPRSTLSLSGWNLQPQEAQP